MAMKAKKRSGGGGNKGPLVAADNHMARVVQVIALGLHGRKPFKGKAKSDIDQLWVTYELVNEFMPDEDGNDNKEKPRWISEKLNWFSMEVENAISTKRMNAIDPSGAIDGDWSMVPDMACLVTVTHSEDGKWANVGSISAPMRGVDVPPLVNKARFFNIDEPDLEIFNALPDFLQKIIKSNLEFKGSILESLLKGDKPDVYEEEDEDYSGGDDRDGAPY